MCACSRHAAQAFKLEKQGRPMIFTLLQVTAVLGAAAYLKHWRDRVRSRNTQTWGSLVARLRPDWNSRELSDPALWTDGASATPEQKWERMHGARGLVAMFQNAGVMLEMADYAERNSDTISRELLASLRSDALQIRISALDALARYAFSQVNESICINALRTASMYMEMTNRMTLLLRANAAGMVPNFVAAM
jgi:hypothetical protein